MKPSDGDRFLKALEAFVLKEIGATMGEKTARRCANALFDCLWLNFRYQAIYVPTSSRENIEKRDQSIYAAFNGSNHNDLAIRYHLSLQSIYKIIKKCRKTKKKDESEKPTIFAVLEEYLPAEFVRCGLLDTTANLLTNKVIAHVRDNYAGAFFRITNSLKKQRDGDNAG